MYYRLAPRVGRRHSMMLHLVFIDLYCTVSISEKIFYNFLIMILKAASNQR